MYGNKNIRLYFMIQKQNIIFSMIPTFFLFRSNLKNFQHKLREHFKTLVKHLDENFEIL